MDETGNRYPHSLTVMRGDARSPAPGVYGPPPDVRTRAAERAAEVGSRYPRVMGALAEQPRTAAPMTCIIDGRRYRLVAEDE